MAFIRPQLASFLRIERPQSVKRNVGRREGNVVEVGRVLIDGDFGKICTRNQEDFDKNQGRLLQEVRLRSKKCRLNNFHSFTISIFPYSHPLKLINEWRAVLASSTIARCFSFSLF
jgi:hypothetical protein